MDLVEAGDGFGGNGHLREGHPLVVHVVHQVRLAHLALGAQLLREVIEVGLA